MENAKCMSSSTSQGKKRKWLHAAYSFQASFLTESNKQNIGMITFHNLFITVRSKTLKTWNKPHGPISEPLSCIIKVRFICWAGENPKPSEDSWALLIVPRCVF